MESIKSVFYRKFGHLYPQTPWCSWFCGGVDCQGGFNSMLDEAQGGFGFGGYLGVHLKGKTFHHRSLARPDLHGFVVSSSLSGVLEDSETYTTEETWQVFVLYLP